MKKFAPYTKALVAFLGAAIAVIIAAVQGTPHHSLGEVGTLGWLNIAASVLGVTGWVYGVPNRAAVDAPPAPAVVLPSSAVLAPPPAPATEPPVPAV